VREAQDACQVVEVTIDDLQGNELIYELQVANSNPRMTWIDATTYCQDLRCKGGEWQLPGLDLMKRAYENTHQARTIFGSSWTSDKGSSGRPVLYTDLTWEHHSYRETDWTWEHHWYSEMELYEREAFICARYIRTESSWWEGSCGTMHDGTRSWCEAGEICLQSGCQVVPCISHADCETIPGKYEFCAIGIDPLQPDKGFCTEVMCINNADCIGMTDRSGVPTPECNLTQRRCVSGQETIDVVSERDSTSGNGKDLLEPDQEATVSEGTVCVA
jgi:hypothetical protein